MSAKVVRKVLWKTLGRFVVGNSGAWVSDLGRVLKSNDAVEPEFCLFFGLGVDPEKDLWNSDWNLESEAKFANGFADSWATGTGLRLVGRFVVW
jgi:hypothetical protein